MIQEPMLTNFVLCLVCFQKPEFPALGFFSLNLLTKTIRDKKSINCRVSRLKYVRVLSFNFEVSLTTFTVQKIQWDISHTGKQWYSTIPLSVNFWRQYWLLPSLLYFASHYRVWSDCGFKHYVVTQQIAINWISLHRVTIGFAGSV